MREKKDNPQTFVRCFEDIVHMQHKASASGFLAVLGKGKLLDSILALLGSQAIAPSGRAPAKTGIRPVFPQSSGVFRPQLLQTYV